MIKLTLEKRLGFMKDMELNTTETISKESLKRM